MPPVSYYSMVRGKDKAFVFSVRMALVREALEHGIKPTMRLFGVSRNTVRLWLHRYEASGTAGVVAESRAPRHCPHKISQELEERIVELKKKLPSWGSQRLKDEYDLPCGHGAIHRVYREHGLVYKRKTRRRKYNDLAAVKALYRPFERVCVDTKYLCDISRYWPSIRGLGLPGFQYTARDQKTGAMFLGYAGECSMSHSVVFALAAGEWLRKHGVELAGSCWLTDGGSEFIGSWQAKDKSEFIKTVESFGAEHLQIPKTTYNADVETVHNTIEMEFFDLEDFESREVFFAKVSTYNHYYNLLRKNTHKWKKSPLEILKEADPKIDPSVLALGALDLDKILDYYATQSCKRGQDVPGSLHNTEKRH